MFWSVGMRSSTSSSAGSGSGARDSDLIRSCSSLRQLDRLLGDFAQRDDRVLVVVAVERQFLAAAEVARALGGEQHQLEAVGNLLDAIFDGDARHALHSPAIGQAVRIGAEAAYRKYLLHHNMRARRAAGPRFRAG